MRRITAVQTAGPGAIEGPPAASLDVGGRALADPMRAGAPGWLLAFAFVLVLGSVTVYVVGDTKKEKDESFFVNLTGGTGVDIGGPKQSQGRVNIINDDK